MTTAREIMNADPRCAQETETVQDAAHRMTDLSVGALPICGDDNRLKGMLTDRDIVRKVLGNGNDTRDIQIGQLAQTEAVTVGADDDAGEIMRTMSQHQVRRLPVVDGDQLVGMVAQADVARSLDNPQVGELLDALSVH